MLLASAFSAFVSTTSYLRLFLDSAARRTATYCRCSQGKLVSLVLVGCAFQGGSYREYRSNPFSDPCASLRPGSRAFRCRKTSSNIWTASDDQRKLSQVRNWIECSRSTTKSCCSPQGTSQVGFSISGADFVSADGVLKSTLLWSTSSLRH